MSALSVIYWRGSAEVRGDLLKALQTDGMELVELRSLEEVLDFVARKKPGALIVDGSAGEREASNRVVELSSSTSLYDIPIVFLSVQAMKRSSALDGRYRQLLPIDIPFQVDKVVERVRQFGGGSDTKQKPATPAPTPAKNLVIRPHGAASKLGGKTFASADTPGAIDDDEVLPTLANPQVIRDVLARLARTDSWLEPHARRVSFLSSSLASILPPGSIEQNNVRAVGLCFNQGFVEDLRGLLKLDVFLHGLGEAEQDFARGLRQSALFAAEHLNERARRTLSTMAAIVERQTVDEDEVVIKEAGLALITELTDRSCWAHGHWSPRGAYRAIRKLQEGKPFAVDRDVAGALIRVLVEAAYSHITLESMFYRRSDDILDPKVKLDEAAILHDIEASIPISVVDLMPGMRLARSVVSKDGVVVLAAMTELDDDLIQRLWRLLAIRPLKHPLTVAARLTHA